MKPAKFIILCLGLVLLSGSLWSEVQRTVEPLIQPIWHQTNPWNGRCPGTGPNRAHAGSHALALAKTMKYWAYPTYGVGSVSYVDDDFGPINQVFTGELAWNNMSNNLVFQTTLRYIALCGAATLTNYEMDYSTSTLANIQYALLNYFTYDTGMQFRNRADNTNFYWKSLIRGELDASRPVIYSATLSNGNEVAFIIDGYNEEGLFHVNWSDVNNADSWVDLNTLSVGGQTITVNNQHMLTGIRPSLGPANIDESFETDFSNFNWQFAGQANWTISTEAAYFGTQSAKSGNISDNQTTSLFIQINVTQADTISFYKKVSCEAETNNLYDHLAFFIDSVEQERWSGDGQWAYHEYPVSAGVHQFRWVYNKDGASDYFGDCAWIDAIDLPEGTTPLNPPQFLEAELIAENDIQVNWSLPNGTNTTLQGYKVYRNGAELLQYSNPNMTSYNDYNLPNGDYTYMVRGVYAEGLSGPSNTSTLTVEVPYAPMNLTAALTGVNSGYLQWQAPPLLRNRVLMGYQVYRDNVPLAQIENPDDLNYVDTGLAQGVYFYEVSAIWQTGESLRSNVAQLAVGVPEPPANVRATVTGSTVTLSWNQVSEPQFVTGFKVFRNGALIATTNSSTQLSWADTNLHNGVYSYYVRAVYTDAESGNSAVVQAVVEVAYPPVNVVAVVNGDDVQLSWTNPELVRSLTHYMIYRNGQIIAAVYNPSTTNYVDQNLPNGLYSYQLSAFYSGTESPLSAPVNALVEILYPPTALTAAVNLADVTLHWTLPVNQGGLTRSFNGYNVYRNNALVAFAAGSTTNHYTDLNRPNGTYNYALTAVYTTGESTPATLDNVVVEVMYPVTALNYVVNGDDVSLSWTAVANAPSRDVDGQRVFINYRVYRNGSFLTETGDLNYTDANLANGVYQYYIKAVYSNGESSPSPSVYAEVEVPYPPTTLIANVVVDDVLLSWTAPLTSGGLGRAFSGYRIFRDGVLLTNVNQPSYTDLNLPNGVYHYQVFAVYAAGLSQPTNMVEAVVEVLYPPQNLSRTVSNRNNVTLNWLAAPNSGGLRTFIGYNVYRNNTLIGTTTLLTYADNALADGTYSYYITASYANGNSLPTNTVSAIIQYPYPPQNVAATVVGANVQLSWNAVAGTGNQYQLFRDGILLTTVTATSYTDINLANGSYSYYLITLNASDSGPSDPSATVSATVNVPYPPRNLIGSVSMDSVQLSWTAPLTGPRNLLAYRIYRDGAYLGSSPVANYTDVNLANSTYVYSVTAQYDNAESVASNYVSLLVEVQYPPTALTHTVNNNAVSLSWTAAVTSGGLRAFQGYKIYRDGNELAQTTLSSYTDPALANGSYQYYVIAVYLTGTSTPSNTVTAVVEVLYPPSGLSYTTSDDDVLLSWQMPVTSGGLRSFNGYNLYRNGTLLGQVSGTAYTDAALANGTYQYYVTALYSSGESAPSNAVTVNLEVLYPATNLAYQVAGDDVSLSWTAAAISGGLRNFVGYKVLRDNMQIAITTLPSYLDANLANGSYVYQIVAVYSSGVSVPTPSVSVLVEVLYAPSGLTGSVVGDSVTLAWYAAPISGRAFTGYNLYREGSFYAFVTTLSYVDSGLANGLYHYYVTAVYGSGESAPSNTVTPLVEVLYPAGSLSYSLADDDVTLSWMAAPISGGLRSLLHYAVYRNEQLVAETALLSFVDSNLPNGTYSYYVRAVYSSGSSTPTNAVSVLVEVLYPPTALMYAVAADTITLNWTAAATSGGLRDFQGYLVYRNGSELYLTTQTTFTDPNLPNGTYQYYVKAVYLSGTSQASNTITAEVNILYPPTALVCNVSGDDVQLVWTAPLGSAGNLTGYQLYRNGLPLAQTQAPNYTDSNLSNGSYTYFVTAEYSSGISLPTNSVTASVEVAYVATNLSANVNSDTVTLTWNLPVTGPRLGLSGFFIYRNNVLCKVLNNTTQTTWSDINLPNGDYSYYLVAVYSNSLSQPSNVVTVNINVMPNLPPPSGFAVSVVGGRSAFLTWNSPSPNVIAYSIYRNNVLLSTTVQTNYIDPNLPNGSFSYHLKAQYAEGMSSASQTLVVNIMVANPPLGLTTTIVSGSNVLLTWILPLQSEVGFIIYRNGTELAYVSDPAATQYLDTALANGTYIYQVAAVYPSLISTLSFSATAYVLHAYQPQEFALATNANNIQLSWLAPADTGGLTVYKIYRNGVQHTFTTALSFTDTNLPNGAYSYYLCAIYGTEVSAPTATLATNIAIAYAPSGLTGYVLTNNVHLSWNAVTDLGGFVTYNIWRNGSLVATSQTNNYLDAGLANGTYNYWITALYSSGESAPSNTVQYGIEITYALNSLVYSISENNINLSWNPPAGISRNLLGYQIFRNNTQIAYVPQTTYQDINLNNGTYTYFLKVVYDSGLSAPSNSVTVPLMFCFPPTGVTASLQDQNNVYLAWNAPGQMETGYLIYLDNSLLATINDPGITNYLDVNHANGLYTYTVIALYGGQQSSPSSPASATIIVPHPPTNLTAMVSENSVQLNWTAPADSWGITRYYITFKKNGSPWLLVSILANFTSFIQPDLPNATYQIYVRASYSTTPPQYSEPTDTLEAVVNIPYVPQNLTGVLLGTTANLSWQAPDDSTGLTGYSILRNNNPIATVTTSTYQDENLPNGDYSYRVCSIYGTDVSIPSTAVALAVWLTYSPSNLTGVAQDNAVSLSWDPPSDTGGFTSYMVQRNEQPIAYTADTVFNDLNIPNGQYQYRIVAGFSFGNSQPSNTYAASISVPHPPVNLRGNVAGNSVHLQWGPPLDATNLSSYRIYRNQQFLAEVNTLIYTDSGLANGEYTYYVQAYYGSLPSTPTASVAMHVEMAYVPSGFAVSATGNNVELTWNAVSDAGFFQYYKVYRNSELLATTPAINYSDPDLANGSYTYAVSAFYQTLESHITVPVEIAINIAYPAQNVSAVAEQETVLVSWNPPLSYGQPDAYKVWFMREGQQLAPQNWVFVADADTVLNVQTTLAADLAAGKYLWAVVALYGTITAEPAFSNTITVTPPEVFTPPVNKLVGNYPNPFNPDTHIVFWLYKSAKVRLEIYNERGQLVRNLFKGSLATGEHSLPWNGTNDAGEKLGTGIYFCKFTTPESQHIRKLMLVK